MNSDDLIRRKDALAALTLTIKTNDAPYVGQYARRALKNIPAVDAVPVVHAYWIHCNGKSHIWYCSNCGEKINYNNAHKTYAKSIKPIEEVNRYCRGCGSKMDGEQRKEETPEPGGDDRGRPVKSAGCMENIVEGTVTG